MRDEEEKGNNPWTARQVLFGVAKAVMGAVGLWSGAITIAGEYGVPLGGFAAWTLENSWWMFPLAAFGCGIWVGWSLKSRKMEEDGIIAERIKELEAERDELKARLDAIDSDEARDRARIDEFTDAQLELMLRMADAPSPGLSLFLTSHDHTLAMSLMEPTEVIAMFTDETRSTCAWHLLPEWNGWVRRNRVEIENRPANP